MKTKKSLSFARQLRKKQTPAEVFFWKKVRNRRFLGKKFKRQVPIEYSVELEGHGSFFIVDFYCSEAKLIVELDGPIHQYQLEYDEERTRVLEGLGFTVIRFANEVVLERWAEVEEEMRKYF
jgi:very-short-patch-repair endonuclease